MSEDVKSYRHDKIKQLRRDAMASKTRLEFAGHVKKISSAITNYGDVETLMGTWWMMELLPDGADRGTRVLEVTLQRLESSLLQTWKAKRMNELASDAAASSVKGLRDALRGAGVMTASENAAKLLVVSRLGGSVKDRHPSSQWAEADKEIRKSAW